MKIDWIMRSSHTAKTDSAPNWTTLAFLSPLFARAAQVKAYTFVYYFWYMYGYGG